MRLEPMDNLHIIKQALDRAFNNIGEPDWLYQVSLVRDYADNLLQDFGYINPVIGKNMSVLDE